HESMEMVIEAGSTPVFAGPKNAAGLVIVTEKNRKFYAHHIPKKYWVILDHIFNKRTRVEQSFHYDSGTYGFSRIPHLGEELSAQFTGLVNCETLLTALTAVKTDQFHLITRNGAFRRFGLAYQGLSLDQMQLTVGNPVTIVG
ncbi:MAG: hypothetical protein ACTSRU_16935, partial [Candidatus Hodarchaeales archaeon]